MNELIQAREIIAAAPDALKQKLGVRVASPHPMSREVTLLSLAEACARTSNPQRAQGKTAIQVLSMGISTSDYPRLVADGLQALVARSFASKAEHLRFCAVVPVKKLGEPIDHLGFIDPHVELLPVGELAEIERFLAPRPAAGVPDVILRTFARIVTISREAIINDELGSFTSFVKQLGVSGARLESRLVVDALEGSPVLDDGEPLFDALNGNVLASAFTATTLGQALALLRKQTLPSGELSDLAGKHLVVSAELEMLARQAVLDAGLDLVVTVMAELPDTRWYLLADQETQPVVGVLRLFGTETPTMVEPASRTALKTFDGTGVRVRADVGAVLLSRTGLVRGGV